MGQSLEYLDLRNPGHSEAKTLLPEYTFVFISNQQVLKSD